MGMQTMTALGDWVELNNHKTEFGHPTYYGDNEYMIDGASLTTLQVSKLEGVAVSVRTGELRLEIDFYS